MARRTKKGPKQVETLTHDKARRRNIPTAELQSMAERLEEQDPFEPVIYERAYPLAQGETWERDEDLDPQIVWKGTSIRLTKEQIDALKAGEKIELGDAQLVWRGKDTQDWSDLVVQAPPIYVQEKIHPKHIIENLKRQTRKRRNEDRDALDLFGDFNGLDLEAKTEFYQHDQNWSNRMILGDSLQVMASLAEREALRGKVQCIYFDPPYGIKFNSNWQVSTRSRDVKDGKLEQITREPEQVKAFRDTWKDGIHSYLTYLRDRLTAMRDLLTDSGSIFVQIGDENVHRVRTLMDEVFGENNFLSLIAIQTTSGFQAEFLGNMSDFVIWYARDKSRCRINTPFYRKSFELGQGNARWLMFDDFTYRGVSAAEMRGEANIPSDTKPYMPGDLASQGKAKGRQPFEFRDKSYDPWDKNSHWKANYPDGMDRLAKAERIHVAENSIRYVRYHTDFDVAVHGNIWTDTGTGNFTDEKIYVVQTNTKVIERCIQMASNPGDLVFDPTCGSGTTATVAEQWGRRWITIDTSRVALALARTRLMSARYPYYLLADTPQGREKEQDVSGMIQPDTPTHNDIRQGFVYERAPHIMLKTIANNAEIDVIWEKWQETLEPLRKELNDMLGLTNPPHPSLIREGEKGGAAFNSPPDKVVAASNPPHPSLVREGEKGVAAFNSPPNKGVAAFNSPHPSLIREGEKGVAAFNSPPNKGVAAFNSPHPSLAREGEKGVAASNLPHPSLVREGEKGDAASNPPPDKRVAASNPPHPSLVREGEKGVAASNPPHPSLIREGEKGDAASNPPHPSLIREGEKGDAASNLPPDKGDRGGLRVYIPYSPELKEKARELRKNTTPAEKKLWREVLSARQLQGYKFLRQKPLDKYIVDFYCAELLLAIEVDGDTHASQIGYDEQRAAQLAEFGITVIRYTNADVLNNIAGVYEDLTRKINLRKSIHHPESFLSQRQEGTTPPPNKGVAASNPPHPSLVREGEKGVAASNLPPDKRVAASNLPPDKGDRGGFQEWEIPRKADETWSDNIAAVHARWWEARIKRQQEIDKSIAQKADVEYLYDRPYEDKSKVRVAGPFTVESLSPHRVIPADEDTLMDEIKAVEGNRPRPKSGPGAAPAQDFATMVLENLRSAGVHQSDKQDRIEFTAMEGWPGDYIAASGSYEQGRTAKRAAIFIGPEFGSITRSDMMAAAREANDARFDVLIACGFNFDAHSSEVNKLGPLPILKAKMNPDLHMADDLKNTGKGNLFVVFGEPDIEWTFDANGNIVVEVLGIDVFDPRTGEVRASGKNDIAAWFIDTDYNEESFFVRHAYFMGANDPYRSLKTSLKAQIDEEAWATLYRDTSRPFARPSSGHFAVKVINHFGDEVMKIFRV